MIYNKIGFKKLVAGFIFILSITLFSAIFSVVRINNSSKVILHLNNDIYPFTDKLAEFKQITLNSKMLITNWVYLQYSIEDKEELKILINSKYPQIKKDILNSIKKAGQEKHKKEIISIFSKMDEFIEINKKIINSLNSFDDYEDPIKVFESEEIIEEEIIPKSKEIRLLTQKFIKQTKKDNDLQRTKMVNSLKQLEKTSIVFGFGMFIIILFSVIYIQKKITNPIIKVRNILIKLSNGEIVHEKVSNAEDVIAEMIKDLNKLSENLNNTSINAHKIGQGDFNVNIKPLSKDDILGNAILEMKNSLKEYSEEMEAKVKERTIKISRQKEIIEEKNKDITSSINYAERIQKASLPALSIIENELKNSFILFKPKDIVSGDFYWFAKVNNKFVVAAIDCTGHGVPGAFMSLVGIHLLSSIIVENKITSPDIILNELHNKIQFALRQSDTSNQDGMDAAICVIDKEKNIVEFAGAKNPLVYIQNNEVIKIKGDKKGIGGNQIIVEHFSKHTIDITSPTSFYIFSDGFQDQFGGEKKRKFMGKNMINLFLENHYLSMQTQKEIYNKTITEWMSSVKQIDDILIIGFQL